VGGALSVLPASARAWGKTLAVVGVALALYVGIALGVTALTGDAILGAAVSDIAAAVLAIAYRWRSTGTPLAGEPKPRARTIGFWITAGVALAVCWTAGEAAAAWIYQAVGSAGFDAVSSDQEQSSLPLLLLTAVILAPLGEESLMRGIAFPALRKHWPPLASAFVTAAVFSILHGNLVQIALTVPLGILLAFVYEAVQRLWPVVTMHVLFNLAGFIVPKGLVDGIANPAMIGVLAAGAVVLLFALTPGRYARRESVSALL
jgi:membrane protease YdiL (CAAX protease family)